MNSAPAAAYSEQQPPSTPTRPHAGAAAAAPAPAVPVLSSAPPHTPSYTATMALANCELSSPRATSALAQQHPPARRLVYASAAAACEHEPAPLSHDRESPPPLGSAPHPGHALLSPHNLDLAVSAVPATSANPLLVSAPMRQSPTPMSPGAASAPSRSRRNSSQRA